MKRHVIAVFCAAVLCYGSAAVADLYQWTDSEGVLHITNDMEKVPQEYRLKIKTYKSTAPKESAPPQPSAAPPKEKGSELYGDHTLDWWMQTFRKKNEEIQALEASYYNKKQFIDLFESGRRFGQIYGNKEVETYNSYKLEIPEDENRVKALKDDLQELRRQATIVGVPRSIRGE